MADRVPDEVVSALFAAMESPEAEASRRHAADLMDDTRSWIDPNGYQLSDRIWIGRQNVRDAIDVRIRTAIANGEDALEAADDLERYLDPAFLPTRTRDGRVIDDGRRGVLTRTGPRNGQGSYPARRLMRTEITRIGGVETDAIAAELDLDVHWLLSNRHPDPDECDRNASGSSPGKPRGVYRRTDAPSYPAHPMCLCVKTTYDDMSDDEMLSHLRRKYGLPGSSQTSLSLTSQAPSAPASLSVEERIRADEARIRLQRDHETGVLYDLDGNVIWRREGGSNYIDGGPEDFPSMRGNIFTHNHPVGWRYPDTDPRFAGNSFSLADWGTFMESGLQEIRAVAPGYRFIARRPAQPDRRFRRVEAWTEEVRQMDMQRIDDQVRIENYARIDAGEISIEEASASHYHQVAERIAESWGVDYERQPITD